MNLIRYLFWSAVDFTERHFDGMWQLFIASVAVFVLLVAIFILSN